MPSPDTRVLTTHVPVALALKVDSLAERLDRSRGWIMKQALAPWVEQEEQRYRMTLEALGDVDADRGVSHEQVKAWAASLAGDTATPLLDWKTVFG
jgi:predicted transcriptional regulator